MNVHKFVGKQTGWTAAASGFALLIIFIFHAEPVGTVNYDIMTGTAYPLLFVMLGYSMKRTDRWLRFGGRVLSEITGMVIPAVMACLFVNVYQYIIIDGARAQYLPQYTRKFLYSIFYSSPADLGDIASIGYSWILIAVFFSRLFINLIHLASVAITHNLDCADYISWSVSIITGIAGVVLAKRYIVLPLSLTNVMIIQMLMTAGIIWRRYHHAVESGWWYWMAFLVAGVVWITGMSRDAMMDIAGLRYMGSDGGIIVSLCGVFFTSCILRWVFKLSVVSDLLSLPVRHLSLVTVIATLDSLYSVIWASNYPAAHTATRVVWYFAIMELIVQTVGKVTSSTRKNADITYSVSHKKLLDVIYYIAFSILYMFAITTYAYMRSYVAANLVQDIIMLCTAILAWVYAMSIANINSRWMPCFMTSVILFSIVYACVRNLPTSELTLFVLIAATAGRVIYGISKISWAAGAVLIVVAYELSIRGYIPYIILEKEEVFPTHAFGFLEKNTLAGFLLGNCIIYCMGRKSNKRLYLLFDFFIIGAAIYINYRYVGGRSDLVLSVLLLAGTFVYRLLGNEMLRFRIILALDKWLHYIFFVPSYVLCLIGSIVIAMLYDGVHVPFANIIEKFTTSGTYAARLKLSKTALLVYKPTFWGQYIFENSSAGNNLGAGFFYIDSSYIKMLLSSGIMVTVIFLILMIILEIRCVRNKQFYLAFLGVIAALMGIMGHRMLDPVFNLVPIITFASFCNSDHNQIGYMHEHYSDRTVPKIGRSYASDAWVDIE